MTPIVLDAAMQALYAEIDRIAGTAVSVLIVGEAGTGKGVIAEAIHERSARAGRAILRIDCMNAVERVLDAELFGHRQGAHEAALRDKEGMLETAYGGAVLIDHVDRLPLSLQTKLASAIDRRELVRAGETEPRPFAARLISSTREDLTAACEHMAFRTDLALMLAGVTLAIPPLRDRPSEIIPLAEHFAAELAKARNAEPPAISDDARAVLLGHSWPGNVRELRNVIEQAVLACGATAIEPAHLKLG